MIRFSKSRVCRTLGLLVFLVFVEVGSVAVLADDFSTYTAAGVFELPDSAGGEEWVFDVLPDGRIASLVRSGAAATLYMETGVATRSFSTVGVLPGTPVSFFLSFLRAAPNGLQIAVGIFDQVAICDLGLGSCVWLNAPHFDATWFDNRYLITSQSGAGIVSVLDSLSPIPASPSNTTIITGFGGIPGGVALDSGGNLFTGNGFALGGPSQTGDIKYFSASAWTTAWMSASPLNFENDGVLVVDLQSVIALGFDVEGNMFGGGAGDENDDFIGLVRASALAGAIGGGGEVDGSDPTKLRKFDPTTPHDSNFYQPFFNSTTRELYAAWYYAADEPPTVHVFRPLSSVPVVSAAGMGWVVAAIGAAGVALVRTRVRVR